MERVINGCHSSFHFAKRLKRLERIVRKVIAHEKRSGIGLLYSPLITSPPQAPNSNIHSNHDEHNMTSRNQSASDSFPSDTTYGAPTAVPSNVTSSTARPSAHRGSTAATADHAGSAHHERTLASIVPQSRVSRYCIEYSEAGGGTDFNFHKLPSDLDKGPSRNEDHDKAIGELVDFLNDGYSRDLHDSQRVVEVQVGNYNNKDPKTHFHLDKPKKCGGIGPAWSASITVESETAALHAAKKVVDKFSSVSKMAASVSRRLRKPGYEQL